MTFLWELKDNVRRAVGRGCSVDLGLKEAGGWGLVDIWGRAFRPQAGSREQNAEKQEMWQEGGLRGSPLLL